jgi:hypothetical protein
VLFMEMSDHCENHRNIHCLLLSFRSFDVNVGSTYCIVTTGPKNNFNILVHIREHVTFNTAKLISLYEFLNCATICMHKTFYPI